MTGDRRSLLVGGAVLTAITAWAFLPVLLIGLDVHGRGGTFTGIDSATPLDQFQYMGWIRDASEHWLIGNPFELSSSSHVFLHPMFSPSGVLVRLGVGMPAAYLIWKLVAAALLFAACWAYAGRLLGPEPGRRAIAVILGVFTVTPALALISQSDRPLDYLAVLNESIETSPGLLLWGYAPAVISIALLPLLFLLVERMLEPGPGRRRDAAWAALCALLMTWLHPWEGQVALLVLAGLAVWRRRRDSVWLLAPAAAVAAALAMYWLLGQTEPQWERARQVALDVPRPPLWVIAVVLAGMVAAALPGLRGARLDAQEVMLRLWPPAALLLLVLPGEPLRHVLQSIMIPLAVLATRAGIRAAERSRPAAVACGLFVVIFTVPGLVEYVRFFRDRLRDAGPPVLLQPGERDAMRWLDSAPPGGVFSSPGVGLTVPALSGRRVWVAHYTWTPDYVSRSRIANLVMDGGLSAARTRAVIRGSGARYVLLPCGASPRAARALRPLARDSRRFGCARVVTVAATAPRSPAAG